MTVARMPGRNGGAQVDTHDSAVAALEDVKFAEFCGAAIAVLVVTVIAIGCSVVWLILGDHP